jgi:hypothetical protein
MKEKGKIYIFCPAYFATGGPELLHQLHFKLKKRGINSFIYYTGKVDLNLDYTNDRLKHYVGLDEIADVIEDNEKNYLVIPETYFNDLKYSKINFLFWWLSVDHFLIKNGFNPKIVTKTNLKNKVKVLINRSPYNRIKEILIKQQIKYHLFQSYYAKSFLESLYIRNVLPLSDYINPNVIYKGEYLNKENIIIYNPQKGIEIIQYLMKYAPSHFRWIPIENMTPEQISKLLSTAKVYVDFGNHPGKDRIPREAVLNNCCIITNKIGSSKNHFDIPISNKYKFENPIESSTQIYKLLQGIFNNFDQNLSKFDNYKKIIINEENLFEEQIDLLLNRIQL